MSNWYVDGWQCVRCTLVNTNEVTECVACLNPRAPPEITQSNEEDMENDAESSENNPYCFEQCGDALRISGHGNNTITLCEVLETLWSTCYGGFPMDMSKNNFKIYLLINNIMQPDGVCIGICSSDQTLLNSHFHTTDGLTNYGYKSDGKSFCNGKKIGRSGNGYKSGDILTISIDHKNITWLVNDVARCVQRDIISDIEYKLAISMTIKSINNSITMLNVEQTEKKCDSSNDDEKLQTNDHISALYQRRTMRKLGIMVMTVGDYWYAVSKKWYDKWQQYTMFTKADDDITGGVENLNKLNMMPPGPIDNTDLIENDSKIRNIVFGFIREIQQLFPMDSSFHIIPTVVQKICLSFYAYPELKKDILENCTHVWVHSQVWDYLFSWHGGGPTIERKVYERGGAYSREEYICVYPRFIKLVYCDDKTGHVNYGNIDIRGVPPAFTLKQLACELEDDIETDNIDDIPYIHFWFPFDRIKAVYVIDKPKAKVSEDDLKMEDPNRLVEMPDDFLKTKVDDVVLTDDDIVIIERKQDDGTWPRNKGDYHNIQIGDLIDCKDEQDKWYESFVRFVYPKGHEKYGKIVVHYIGWNIKWDLELEINDENMTKRNMKTNGPHRPRRRQHNYGGYGNYGF